MNFANLKKQSKDFNGLLKQVEKMNGGGSYEKEETDNY